MGKLVHDVSRERVPVMAAGWGEDMRILDKAPSREPCAEAGWFAWDYRLKEPATADFIRQLKPLGSFVFLQMLKKPFYKIESDHFLIRGVQGDDWFRLAVHRDYPQEIERVERWVESIG